jgi:hypothetical protein
VGSKCTAQRGLQSTTQEASSGGSLEPKFKASLGNVARPHLKTNVSQCLDADTDLFVQVLHPSPQICQKSL